MSEQTQYARLLCGGFALCLVLASAMLIEAPALASTAGILNATPLNAIDGQQIYEHVCRGCHMADAGGAVGAGHYPALAKDPTLVSRQYMALTILTGRRNMPAFGAVSVCFGAAQSALLLRQRLAGFLELGSSRLVGISTNLQ